MLADCEFEASKRAAHTAALEALRLTLIDWHFSAQTLNSFLAPGILIYVCSSK